MKIPDRTVERVILYRRRLRALHAAGQTRIYSHELAGVEGVTPAQVRRDLMTIGYTGSPAKGYDVAGLITKIDETLNPHQDEGVVLVGVGRLGKAFLAYFAGQANHLPVVAAFDVDQEMVGRLVHGCRCYGLDELETVLAQRSVRVAFLTVPGDAAQEVADRLVRAGIRGLVNLAPIRLRVPPDVYVEYLDITVSLEKVAFFARRDARAAAGSS